MVIGGGEESSGNRRDGVSASEKVTAARPGRPAHAAHFEPGQRLGRYALGRRLGAGGFAEVWEAEDAETGRRLALKVLPAGAAADTESLARFEREGRLAAAISHPSCVYVFGAERVEGVPLIAMELMEGGTLQDLIDREGPLAPERAVGLVLDLLDGLEAAQAAGVLHRDIKPANCFLDHDGRARIGDFGISREILVDRGLTATGAFLGTPAFASPEQVRGRDLDVRSDLYSLGATLTYLLTGKPPHDSTSGGDLLASIVADPPVPLRKRRPDLSAGLERAVGRFLERDPKDRPQTHAQARELLRPFAELKLVPAERWRRVLAWWLDQLLLSIPFLVYMSVTGESWDAAYSQPLTWSSVLLALVPQCAWFSPFERLWGTTPGKRLLELVVVDERGGRIGWTAALLRPLLFQLPVTLTYLLFLGAEASGVAVLGTAAGLLVFVTMRRHNGWAGVHDLLTRTRVRRRLPASSTRSPRSLAAAPAPRALGPVAREDEMRGPFRITGIAWRRGTEALLAARDERLQRDAWIHERPTLPSNDRGAEPPSRATRLRWLQAGVAGGVRWDAYEAPAGRTLDELVASRGALDTAAMRELAPQLLEELAEGADRGDLPPELGPDRVLLDSSGRLRLLPFPLRDAEIFAMPSAQWRAFFWWVLEIASTGRVEAQPTPSAYLPQRPLPFHLREPLERLAHGGLEPAPARAIATELRATWERPSRVTRALRARMHAAVASCYVVTMAMALATLVSDRAVKPDLLDKLGFTMGVLVVLLTLGAGFLAPILAVWMDGGLGLRRCGVGVARADGRMATQLQMLVRPIVAWWIPSWLALITSVVVKGALDKVATAYVAAIAVWLLIMLGGVAWSLVEPERGLVDRMCGTHLVPR